MSEYCKTCGTRISEDDIDQCHACASRKSELAPVDWFSAVFGVLITYAGADAEMHHNFVMMHTEDSPCDEYRFQGLLGFGGKYRRKTNTVDCYPEDLNLERKKLIDQTNTQLKALNS